MKYCIYAKQACIQISNEEVCQHKFLQICGGFVTDTVDLWVGNHPGGSYINEG